VVRDPCGAQAACACEVSGGVIEMVCIDKSSCRGCPSGHQDLSIAKQGCLVPNPCASHMANARESTRGGVEKLCRGKSSCSVRPSCYQDPSVGKPGCCMPSAGQLPVSGRREAAGLGARAREGHGAPPHGGEQTD